MVRSILLITRVALTEAGDACLFLIRYSAEN